MLCLSALSSFEASAQRTSRGVVHIGASQMVSVYSIPSGGFEVNAGMYLLNSYWKAGLCAVDYNQKVTGSFSDATWFDHVHYVAYGDWMYRIIGTYSRSVNFYAGGGIFLGYNSYEVFKKLPDELASGLPGGEFIYGIKPCVELECFVSRKVAITLGVDSPFTFSSSLSTDLWHLTGSLGVRVNL